MELTCQRGMALRGGGGGGTALRASSDMATVDFDGANTPKPSPSHGKVRTLLGHCGKAGLTFTSSTRIQLF